MEAAVAQISAQNHGGVFTTMGTGAKKTGRPIGFDRDAALEAAMLLFWERGFEGTSMADLTQAMNLSASSIYAAFGDKHSLFSHTVNRYLETRAQYVTDALAEPTLEKVIHALFDNTVAFLTGHGHPPTCMSLAGAMGCSREAVPARKLMTEVRRANEAAIRNRLLQARKAGELPREINVDDYTRYISMLLAGLSIQTANGSTKAELKRTAQMALKHLGYSNTTWRADRPETPRLQAQREYGPTGEIQSPRH
jgi:AcrR family transcriptional regulator